MRFINKQQIGVTKLNAVFYKSKLTFHFSKTLFPPKVYENPHGGRRGGEEEKKKVVLNTREEAFITHILQS